RAAGHPGARQRGLGARGGGDAVAARLTGFHSQRAAVGLGLVVGREQPMLRLMELWPRCRRRGRLFLAARRRMKRAPLAGAPELAVLIGWRARAGPDRVAILRQ